MEIHTIFIIFSLIFGAIFGSFITMASHRLPKGEDIFIKKSYCPICNNNIPFFSLIPIISWVLQGGKCKFCKQKISIRYPIIEIITSVLFLLSYIKYGFTCNTIILNLIIVVCLIMFFSDLETYIIPNSMQICLLILNLIFIYYNGINIFYSVISAFIYFIIIYFAGFIVKKIKCKEAIGGGDIKFITIVGLILTLDYLPIFLFLSGMIGIIFGLIWKFIKKNEYFPFAPALISSFLLLFYCCITL